MKIRRKWTHVTPHTCHPSDPTFSFMHNDKTILISFLLWNDTISFSFNSRLHDTSILIQFFQIKILINKNLIVLGDIKIETKFMTKNNWIYWTKNDKIQNFRADGIFFCFFKLKSKSKLYPNLMLCNETLPGPYPTRTQRYYLEIIKNI